MLFRSVTIALPESLITISRWVAMIFPNENSITILVYTDFVLCCSQLPTQREIDEESDGSSDNESALIFCDATLINFNNSPRTRKVYAKAKAKSGGKEDEEKPSTLSPEVSTDDSNSRGDIPRATVDGLDGQTDNANLYLNKFDSFFKVLEILEKEHCVKQSKPVVRKLPEIGRSKSHLMTDWSPRCIAIVRIEHQGEGYFLLEVDTSDGRASIATKVISARALQPIAPS